VRDAAAVDLHLHSTASDGRLAPAELVRHAAARGVRHLALTDHDTTAGVAEAAAAAAVAGVGFVPGIELSADWRGRGIHVLGLAIDPNSPALQAGIERLHAIRAGRAERIADRLEAARAPGRAALAAVLAATALPTRTHFARALVDLGAARDAGDAFDRLLRRGRPGYVSSQWPGLAEVTAWIVAAGGTAVLAHPLRYTLSNGARRELAREFREAGGRGIEVATGGASAAQFAEAVTLATRTGLDGSAGSDFHDPAIAWNPPGRLAKLPALIRPVWASPPFPRDFGCS
jgi:predicted metal-dependent phosphoesterase TrpH